MVEPMRRSLVSILALPKKKKLFYYVLNDILEIGDKAVNKIDQVSLLMELTDY